jgi:hypothetical protein
MRRLAALLLTLGLGFGAHAASVTQWTITRIQWSGVVTAAQVLEVRPLQAAIVALDALPGSRLVVIHNGGENGLFWASDLEGWLVALGVPSARIVNRIGAIAPDKIRLRIEPASRP